MENVTQVHGKKNVEHFDQWIKFLESKGYSNYWKDLNAKGFGIPQNRNRTFMVSVLGNYTYEFPKEFPLELRLKDMLEDSVDEKFYISNERVDKIVSSTFAQEKTRIQTADVCGTLLARDYKDPKCVEVEPKVIGGIGEKKSNGGTQWYQQDRNYDNNVAISVTTGFNPYYKVEEPIIQKVDIPQTVRVRKHPIDTDKLVQVLREHKNISNQEIADRLDVPLTKVEHWFRRDKCFAIPDAEIWFELKSLLNIQTNEFDESITVFEEKDNVFEKSNRCYFSNGIAPTITSASADEKIIEPVINVVGNYSPSGHDASRIVDASGLAPTVKENHGTVTAICEPLALDEQNGYIRKDGTVGTLTTDGSSPKHNNRVVEPVRLGYIPYPNSNKAHQSNTFYDENAISPTLDTCTGGNRQVKIQHNNLRIRKLTPKECWRLMGFDDADFEKASQYNSNSQLYKQAGNSIVVDVLYYIFKQMFAESEETL
jgi:site-specific DNA-cytosine methylase